ncbi:flagellar FlbD family protein [Arthrobacter sp. H41]|uniref:flagellar FlbD family protein n=1 Tax=Arthrobacter sp. H41 TaxID=1312978 RepID=UPI0004791E6A|nr:flagellar FlbD family protein [Arthrobacter sp. H41]
MIVVTRLNDSRFAVNPDLIERIHSNPDTTLVMVDGAKYIVTEPLDEVISMIASYRAHVIRLARDLPETPQHHPQLGLVPNFDDVPDPDGGSGTPGGSGDAHPVPLRPRNP